MLDICVTVVQVCFMSFQAEDGIRDIGVTGVQTCALPIWQPVCAMGDRRQVGGCRQETSVLNSGLCRCVSADYHLSKVGASGAVFTGLAAGPAGSSPDRKSTRLNSSHANISYAVFCLKKKK